MPAPADTTGYFHFGSSVSAPVYHFISSRRELNSLRITGFIIFQEGFSTVRRQRQG